jgi:hypothetical protein
VPRHFLQRRKDLLVGKIPRRTEEHERVSGHFAVSHVTSLRSRTNVA